MVENASKLSCGACGHKTFEVYSQGKGNEFKIIVECGKCQSTTIVGVEPTKLKMSWGDKSEGVLCHIGG